MYVALDTPTPPVATDTINDDAANFLEPAKNKATIRKIARIEPHPNADKLEMAVVDGWRCVVGKGQFKEGDLAVYFEIDSLLPDFPCFAFLKPRATFKDYAGYGGVPGVPYTRLKTAKFRGELSQGLLMPRMDMPQVYVVASSFLDYPEGTDVTQDIGVCAYTKPLHGGMRGQPKGNFPSFLKKTDETRIQNCTKVLAEFQGKPYYITTKMDGTSATYYWNAKTEEGGVCSRNLEIKKPDGEVKSVYWMMEEKYNIIHKLRGLAERFNVEQVICVQGEICGPGIQGNPAGLSSVNLFLFNLWIDGKYKGYLELREVCDTMQIPMVPECAATETFTFDKIEDLLVLANAAIYTWNGKPAEGLVFRPKDETYSPYLKDRLSFKVISNKWLLEGGD